MTYEVDYEYRQDFLLEIFILFYLYFMVFNMQVAFKATICPFRPEEVTLCTCFVVVFS